MEDKVLLIVGETDSSCRARTSDDMVSPTGMEWDGKGEASTSCTGRRGRRSAFFGHLGSIPPLLSIESTVSCLLYCQTRSLLVCESFSGAVN